MALIETPQAELGMHLPSFRLRATDGKFYSHTDFLSSNGRPTKALLVMFICNHCPYVQAIEDRLIALGSRYPQSAARLVGICSNDAESYPADSFEEMKKRSEQKGYPFLYLHDEDQSAARAFGAVCTPDFFLFNANHSLAYRGRLDDSWKDPSLVTRNELADAIDQLLEGKSPAAQGQRPSMGCSIKWKSQR